MSTHDVPTYRPDGDDVRRGHKSDDHLRVRGSVAALLTFEPSLPPNPLSARSSETGSTEGAPGPEAVAQTKQSTTN